MRRPSWNWPCARSELDVPKLSGVRATLNRMTTFSIIPEGAYSLRESAEFGFGQRHGIRYEGTMRLAFCADDLASPAGVALTQDAAGVVHAAVTGSAPLPVVARQTARMMSLDVDARPYEATAARDPVTARVIATAPGLRPPLFHSPYEAAAWCVLSLRWNARQATGVRERLARAHGTVLDVAGVEMAAFPTPEQLLGIAEFPGLPALKLERMHGVAQAALAGRLDPAWLRAAEPAEATARLREIPGIGPFSASLVVMRASGVCDVPVEQERHLQEIVGQLYGLGRDATAADMARIGEAWRPFRTWIAVLLRAASSRLDAAPAGAA